MGTTMPLGPHDLEWRRDAEPLGGAAGGLGGRWVVGPRAVAGVLSGVGGELAWQVSGGSDGRR
ncbi:hypothetical protein GCM10010430_57550 [Kitasatospora cystarginea]|uniref:Uncharacterized protein n=1 Tax=Kitasatospora cystarginea TaxID=58350 RepID=A0ABP5RMJ2_9ACTN